ncbi:glyoxalase [Williamsia sp. Leaf354]|uniref:VOC family protein n=1 Tax=Williamsia sp. Leaf354 TaxID=1736349 RepID=UPI000701BC3F|nr:VOC family protein [Williamsia sp. Leaf354]KQR99358.1 glyoxalase [Williamsia sp. Leaf354]
MSRMLFVNLPVADVSASRSFFTGLGFDINEAFSDKTTISVVLSDMATVMMLQTDRFRSFLADGDITDTSTSREALLAISADSREAVDALADAALAAGGSQWTDPQDHGFMYGRSFRDLDGHAWEVVWMDPAQMPAE